MENRPRHEGEAAILRTVDRRAGQVGGHEIGRTLDAREAAIDRAGQPLHRAGLGQARRTFDQKVATGQKRDQEPFDQRLASDEPARQMRDKPVQLARRRLHLTSPAALLHGSLAEAAPPWNTVLGRNSRLCRDSGQRLSGDARACPATGSVKRASGALSDRDDSWA